MLFRFFIIEKLILNYVKCYGNFFKYRYVFCVGVEDIGFCRNVSYCVLSRIYIYIYVYYEYKYCVNIYIIISFFFFFYGYDSFVFVWV